MGTNFYLRSKEKTKECECCGERTYHEIHICKRSSGCVLTFEVNGDLSIIDVNSLKGFYENNYYTIVNEYGDVFNSWESFWKEIEYWINTDDLMSFEDEYLKNSITYWRDPFYKNVIWMNTEFS